MGCASSSSSSSFFWNWRRSRTRITIPEVSVLVPSLRVPVHTNLIPMDLADSIASLRDRITTLHLRQHQSTTAKPLLDQYLPLLLRLLINNKEYDLQHSSVEYRWKELGNGNGKQQEIGLPNPWFEVLSILHMMATLTLMDANLKLIPTDTTSIHSERLVSADCMREAVDLLIKAAGYLNCCVHHILPRFPPEMKNQLPSDFQEGVLEAISLQALAQGTEVQLGLAVQSQNATLSVKRRLACEQLSFFAQAHCFLLDENGKKQSLFLKWKYLEAKAGAYYYHGLILDKGMDPSSHMTALCCFLAAEELLAESKKSCLAFCLADPITRAPPPWGAMKHLGKKIPEMASKKSQMYGYLLDQDHKGVPDLPEFELSLKADEYELPEVDLAWDT